MDASAMPERTHQARYSPKWTLSNEWLRWVAMCAIQVTAQTHSMCRHETEWCIGALMQITCETFVMPNHSLIDLRVHL